ncbi:sensor histidine kinase [Winogradskya consettensis]|uniref:sensor histidine kinase n=1 Tax=Winogradskya consettensis TaxID=113560 RepID=UPI001FD39665|nr:ATP-binding protein [Actinoplanes consettensis]
MPDDALLRGRLPWLIVAPAGAAALLFAAMAGYLWASGPSRSDVVLIVAFLAGVVVLCVAAGKALSTVRRAEDLLLPLRSEAGAAQADALNARAESEGFRADAENARALAETARAQAETARATIESARAEAENAKAAAERAHTEAEAALAEAAESRVEAGRLREAAKLPSPTSTPAGRQVEVFVNLSRRLQSLVHREIKLLDALENEVEDPDLLKGLFQVDHLATRIRRHAENLAVLGGAVSRRQWSRPVALTEVLRSAIAEVEHYSRVKLVPPIEGTVPGHAVASIIHLVAELIENATMFAPPQTQVLLRAQMVTAGVVVEVEDRGLGMQAVDRERVNRLLSNPDDINLDELLRDGRIGLFVVSMIARQHHITVQLQANIYGGTQAVIVLPRHLLGSAQDDPKLIADRPKLIVDRPKPIADRPEPIVDRPKPLELTRPAPAQAQLPSSPPPPAWPAKLTQPTPAKLTEPATPELEPVPAGETATTPPPLPRRSSQTHLAPQLQSGPPQPPTFDDEGETDPGLMASFLQGVSRSEAGEQPPAAGPR